MTEEWRPISRNNNYMVSSYGRVYSHISQKFLRPGIASNGYPTVALGRGNTRTVHSLVAENFIGPCPDGQEVRHGDDNRENPRLDNLCYGTRSDNMKDAANRSRRDCRAYGIKAAATKDTRYPGWRSLVFKPVKFSRKGATT